MKRDFLEGLGLEKETIDKILDEASKDIGREKARTEQAKQDLVAAQEQLSQREKDMETLKAAAGESEGIRKQLTELQEKYAADTEAFRKQLEARDYADAVAHTIADSGIRFTSRAAEKAFIADLKAKSLELKDGKLSGFDDFLKAQREADPAAFQTDAPSPAFVRPAGSGSPPPKESKGAMYARQFSAQYTGIVSPGQAGTAAKE